MDFDPNGKFPAIYAHSQGVHDALAEAVMEVHDVFQRIAPRDTGMLVASAHPIMSRTKDGWAATYAVPVENKQGTKYAKFVEFGTSKMRAQHPLQYSLEIVEQDHM